MPRLHRDFVAELKARIDLHDVVAPYVSLKRSGADWKGLSPFNQEKTPSFYVHPDKGFFKCFSSGEAGDAISFIQKVENLDFQEAVEFLATRFNINLRYEETPHGSPQGQSLSHRKALFDIHELAMSWYREQFWADNEGGQSIRRYWTQERNFPEELAKEFGIGYAPPDSTGLIRVFTEKGISQEVLDKSGLFFDRKGRPDFLTRFRGRLMIPIRDTQERVVAFTARQLPVTPENDPARDAKYINSPETQIFRKGNLLFNLDKARRHIDENKRFLLVEGQLDAIRCWEQGVKNVVAPQGTAFTDGQAHLLRRYRPAGIDCLLDGDEAGRKAALRILPICVKSALDIRFLLLPRGGDPDDLLRSEGLVGLENLIAESLSGIAFAVSMYLGETKKPTPTQKNTVLEHIFEIVAETDSLVARDEYLAQAIRLMKLEESSARQEFARFLSKKKSSANSSLQRASSEKVSLNASQKLTTAEDDLLLFVLHHNEIGAALAQVVQPEWLNLTSPSGTILAKALAEIREDNGNGLASLDELLENDDERNTAYEILSQKPAHDDPVDMHKACNASLQALFNRYFKAKENELRERFANLNPDGIDQLTELRAKLASLRSQRGSLPQLKFVQQPETENNSTHVTDQRKSEKSTGQKSADRKKNYKESQDTNGHEKATFDKESDCQEDLF